MIGAGVSQLREEQRRASFWAGLLDLIFNHREARQRAATQVKINHSAIRVAGHELSGICHTVGVLGDQVEQISVILSREMLVADPTTEEGRAIERLALEVGRLSMRLHCRHTMLDLADEMKNSGGVS